MGSAKHTTREAWLTAASEQMTPWFARVQANEVPALRVSCAWAKRAGKNKVGWCWHREVSGDGVNEIQISPELDDPAKVLATLLHEMIHASDNGVSAHRGYFRKTALDLGLTGKMTGTVAGAALAAQLKELAGQLGTYPHAALTPGLRIGKQSTRMLKVVCPDDQYTVRTTRKWLDLGMPVCPCGAQMEEAA